MLLQKEWQFFQHVSPSAGNLFAALEAALRENFLPPLLGGRIEELTELLCKRINWDMNWAGIWIPYLNQTAPDNFETSEHCCEVLTASLLVRKALDLRAHATRAK